MNCYYKNSELGYPKMSEMLEISNAKTVWISIALKKMT